MRGINFERGGQIIDVYEKKLFIRAGLALSLGSLCVLGAFLFMNQQSPTPAYKPRYVWKKQAEFRGDEARRTENFRVSAGPWRLKWRVKGPPSATSVGLTVMSTALDSGAVFERTGIASNSRGSVEIRDSGEYYIVVSAYEGEWVVIAESLEPADKQPKIPRRPLTLWEKMLKYLGITVLLGNDPQASQENETSSRKLMLK